MWLLSTKRAELKWFISPTAVPAPGYAILSHVWDREEQTFQETVQLCAVCAKTGGNPRDHAAQKIRNFCIVAEKDGYDWVWADICCIDKSSSAELSEALNSMYEWYAGAAICYAYLVDVQSTTDVDNRKFRRSKWHTRGWTLQELIAPEFVVFLNADWKEIGTKATLAHVLEETTRVPVDLLC